MVHSIPPPPGIYTPLVTFYQLDFSVDLEAISQHALRIANGGVAGLVLQGSNGEAVHLDNDERQTVIKKVRHILDYNGFQHLKIIAGVGAPSEKATVRLAKEASSAGADYALVLPPSYWPGAMTMPALLKFFNSVADQSPIPVLIYNFPMVANGINIDSDTMIQLAQHHNIVGCKLTCGSSLNRTSGICTASADTRVPPEFLTLSGKAEFALHGFAGGAAGCTAALVNLAPKIHVALYKSWNDGDLVRAKELQDFLSDADLAQAKLGVSGLKLAVSHYFGYGSGLVRSPLTSSSDTKVVTQHIALELLIDLEKSL